MAYRVDVVKVGQIQVPSLEIYWLDLTKVGEWEYLNFLVAIIRDDDHVYLINSGIDVDDPALANFWKSSHPRQVLQAEVALPQRLREMGILPRQVAGIFLTPLTAYTTGNLWAFPNADIFLSRRGWIDFWAPCRHTPRLPKEIYIPQTSLDYLCHQGFNRVVLLDDGEQVVVPGIRSQFVGTHHRSSMVYWIQTRSGTVAFSDCVFKYPNIEEGKYLGIAENLEENLAAYDLIRQRADIVIPPYDPEVLRRYPGGHVA